MAKQEIDNECIKKGYASCVLIKKAIDDVLHQNAIDRANLGVSSTKAQRNEVKKLEKQRLKALRHLDQEKIDRLLNEE